MAAQIALEVMLAHELEFERIVACLFDEWALTESGASALSSQPIPRA